MKKVFAIISVGFLLWNCGSNGHREINGTVDQSDTSDTIEEYIPIDATSEHTDMHNAQNSLDIEGTYKGITPCADCEGISTEVTLKADSSYTLKTKYLGKGDGKFSEQQGSFTWIDGSIIELKSVNNAPAKYFVGENTLTQLDMNGDKITGDLADYYVLKK